MLARPRDPTIFAFETSINEITNSSVSARAKSLGASWIRLNGVLWGRIQPFSNAPYNWVSLAPLDQALIRAQQLGLKPVVIVRGTPTWASVTGSNCAAVKDQYLGDFARFMGELVQRYKDQVSYWEIGNEVDVNPRLVPSNSPFGCWGDMQDPYYGGERYARMLRAVVPTMRAADPNVKIVLGGLLLSELSLTDPSNGHPERFLEGVLRGGGASWFDIVAYHSYPVYNKPSMDHDLDPGFIWSSMGGWTVGKANYLRGVMARYGVNKPLWLNKTGLICMRGSANCTQPSAAMLDAQADHLIRIMSRAAAAGIQQVSWYTLSGPGWRNGGLLNASQNPRPSYLAYKQMIGLVIGYRSVTRVADYGAAVEAYRFVKAGTFVDVLWSSSGSTVQVQVPARAYRSAVARNGTNPITAQTATTVTLAVGFPAVFITRVP